ncbi:MAG: hypothetical protein ABIQ11_09850 [Saprospiraceae bacterium]
MPILQIEHQIADYAGWKRAFDSDPINRKKSGVTRYEIFRPVDNPHYVVINLYFNSADEAEATHSALQQLWFKVEGTVIQNPKSRILEMVETMELH